ncbi:MAG: hypothetical protein IJM35_07680 [Bacteroidales bacterium]|nr:hypothetical protein [Bacteroidales bacterium]
MKKTLSVLSAAALLLAGCASVEKMAEMAENVKVTCTPEVLEAAGGSVDATVSVTYPADYFNPKAILEVTPVIVYDGGEAAMSPLKYQGEKVKDNYKVVSSDGQTVTEKLHFEYVEGMEKCHLELRGVAKAKGKSVNLPSRKVADGCNTTYMLVKNPDGVVTPKKDAYQSVLTQSKEGQILYQVNSSEVRSSELKGQSIKDFQAALDAISKDGRCSVKGTEIVAYASPEGSEDLNNKLSGKRGESAGKAWKEIAKGRDVAAPEVKSVGEDWEGFQQLVGESNIEDKELILRVLSMYSDPAVRESEIRNMSEVYTALKGEVLPELRRARFIANVEYQNYTEEELLKMVEDNSDVLDEEALLKAATLVKKDSDKEALYRKAVNKYGSDRAQFNLGAIYLEQGKLDKAEAAFKKVKESDSDLENALGVVALRRGDLEAAGKHFAKAGTDAAKANAGVLDILSGNYDKAVNDLKDAGGCCHNLALSYILTDQLDKAAETIHCNCPKCWYLKAIIAARQGRESDMKKCLDKAYKDPELKERASKDIEFTLYNL